MPKDKAPGSHHGDAEGQSARKPSWRCRRTKRQEAILAMPKDKAPGSHPGDAEGQSARKPSWRCRRTKGQEAILAMPKDKTPGSHGIPTKFFQEFMSEVSPTLLQALSAMLRNGETSELINKGLIILIPKSGDQARIGN
jgi:hypothetical protein